MPALPWALAVLRHCCLLLLGDSDSWAESWQEFLATMPGMPCFVRSLAQVCGMRKDGHFPHNMSPSVKAQGGLKTYYLLSKKMGKNLPYLLKKMTLRVSLFRLVQAGRDSLGQTGHRCNQQVPCSPLADSNPSASSAAAWTNEGGNLPVIHQEGSQLAWQEASITGCKMCTISHVGR